MQACAEQVNLDPVDEAWHGTVPKNRLRRDGLGQFCFWLHVAMLLFIVAGWLLPVRALLIGYLVFLPLVMAHWKLNRDACVLNNIETWLRHRRWRAPDKNPEEGAWLRTLIQRDLTGIALTRRGGMDLIIYGAMAGFWALAWAHLLGVMPWRFAV